MERAGGRWERGRGRRKQQGRGTWKRFLERIDRHQKKSDRMNEKFMEEVQQLDKEREKWAEEDREEERTRIERDIRKERALREDMEERARTERDKRHERALREEGDAKERTERERIRREEREVIETGKQPNMIRWEQD